MIINEQKVNFVGKFSTGEIFENRNNKENPFKFVLGRESLIEGFYIGISSMKKGEIASLICSPDYAYGSKGYPPKIPENATLHYEVILILYHKIIFFDLFFKFFLLN